VNETTEREELRIETGSFCQSCVTVNYADENCFMESEREMKKRGKKGHKRIVKR
jgi:hypothetical protein